MLILWNVLFWMKCILSITYWLYMWTFMKPGFPVGLQPEYLWCWLLDYCGCDYNGVGLMQSMHAHVCTKRTSVYFLYVQCMDIDCMYVVCSIRKIDHQLQDTCIMLIFRCFKNIWRVASFLLKGTIMTSSYCHRGVKICFHAQALG